MKQHPILVAGGGIAGVAAALAAAVSGRDALVFERAAAFEEVGAGLQLGPNAVKALQRIGAWDEVSAIATAPPAIILRDAVSGRTVRHVHLAGAFESLFGAPYRVAHRAHLHGALLAAAAKHPSITIRGGCAVEDIQQNVDGVSLTLQNGETHAGDVLIAADGMRSGIRQKVWPGSASIFAGQIIYRTLIDMPSALEDGNCVNLWMGSGFHCVHYPVGREARLNIVLTAHEGQLTDDIIDQCCPQLQDLLAMPKSWLPWEARHVPALESWVKGRVALLGDAAHGTVPYFAQGSAMALEDAALLADLLRDAGTLPVNFAHLNKRMPRVAAVHQASVRQGKIYSAKGPVAAARNLVLRMMPDRQFLSQLAWLYKNA